MKAIIALGNKAQNGKDSVAQFAQEILSANGIDSSVVRWSDELYEEVKNRKREQPLIMREKSVRGNVFYLLDTNTDQYKVFLENDFPALTHLFNERKIEEYWGMDEKDSPILQIWGTDFRRRYFGADYWLKKGVDEIVHRFFKVPEQVILIPDTRFKNELEAVIKLGGSYVNVVRLNEDGSRYIDDGRDPNHRSETELDDVEARVIVAKSGDMEGLKNETENILKLLGLIQVRSQRVVV